VIVIRRERGVDVFALELKRESRRNRKMTEHELRQGEVRIRLENCGVTYGVAYGLDDALTWLEGHGLLEGKKV